MVTMRTLQSLYSIGESSEAETRLLAFKSYFTT